MFPFLVMSLEQKNSETEMPSETVKKQIKEALDETFGPLLLQMAKNIKEISESVKSQLSFNEIMAAKVNMLYTLQTESQTKLIDLESLSTQIEKLDKSLGKFFQKILQDMKNFQTPSKITTVEQVETPTQTSEPIAQATTPKEFAISRGISTSKDLTSDKQAISELIREFSKHEIYTTEALRLIEDMRDKLLFDREDEVPYRAFAAKTFREVLAIAKQEKDFRTISEMAASDIRKHLSYLLDHI